MSINLGIYDFFSFTIPGLLYLYAFNEISRSIGWKFFDVYSWATSNPAPGFIFIVLIFSVAYLLGHLMDPISQMFLDTFSKLRKRSVKNNWLMYSVKGRYPSLNISFESRDRTLLFALIRQRNIELARILDNFSSNSIMFRNVSFGLVFLLAANVILYISTKDTNRLFIALIALVLCFLSAANSLQYREWFVKDIFRASLEYGANVEDVVAYSKNKDNKSKPVRLNKKSKQSRLEIS